MVEEGEEDDAFCRVFDNNLKKHVFVFRFSLHCHYWIAACIWSVKCNICDWRLCSSVHVELNLITHTLFQNGKW